MKKITILALTLFAFSPAFSAALGENITAKGMKVAVLAGNTAHEVANAARRSVVATYGKEEIRKAALFIETAETMAELGQIQPEQICDTVNARLSVELGNVPSPLNTTNFYIPDHYSIREIANQVRKCFTDGIIRAAMEAIEVAEMLAELPDGHSSKIKINEIETVAVAYLPAKLPRGADYLLTLQSQLRGKREVAISDAVAMCKKAYENSELIKSLR